MRDARRIIGGFSALIGASALIYWMHSCVVGGSASVAAQTGPPSSQVTTASTIAAQRKIPTPIPPMSRDRAANAFEEMAGTLQADLSFGAVLGAALISRMQLELNYGRLDEARADAAICRDGATKELEAIADVQSPRNLEEIDQPYFDTMQQAASDLASDVQDVAVDLAAAVDFGVIDHDDIARANSAGRKHRAAFEAAVYAGYRHFGHPRRDVDPTTFRLVAVQ